MKYAGVYRRAQKYRSRYINTPAYFEGCFSLKKDDIAVLSRALLVILFSQNKIQSAFVYSLRFENLQKLRKLRDEYCFEDKILKNVFIATFMILYVKMKKVFRFFSTQPKKPESNPLDFSFFHKM